MKIPQKNKGGSKKHFRQSRRSYKGGKSKIRNNHTAKLESSINIRNGFGATPPPNGGKEKQKPQEIPKKLAYFCKVCGDKASNHTHYGGRSCHSCRAFFRRTVEVLSRYIKTDRVYMGVLGSFHY